MAVELTREEEAGLRGEQGEIVQMAYRILVATGEATDAERLVPVEWAHLSGVNYNTIGDAGQEFLAGMAARDAEVRVRTTLNPMGFDADSVSDYGLDENFVSKQLSIRDSYGAMGVDLSFSCIPYEIFDSPRRGTQVAFAESNAAIHANSYDGLRTNKESAFSALASAITGKSPYSSLRMDGDGGLDGGVTVRMAVDEPDETTYGMLGYFAGKVGDTAVRIAGLKDGGRGMDRRQCKAMCGGMGTSGTCAKFLFDDGQEHASRSSSSATASTPRCEEIGFGEKEARSVHDELNTAERGDMIALGSPQLGLEEIMDLAARLRGRSFTKRCMVFCPRTVREQAAKTGHTGVLERAGCEVLSDCCTCLTPLIDRDETDAVTTNSVKGAFYMKNFSGVGVNLKPLEQIIRDETDWR